MEILLRERPLSGMAPLMSMKARKLWTYASASLSGFPVFAMTTAIARIAIPGHSPQSSHTFGQSFLACLKIRNTPWLLGGSLVFALHNANVLSASAKQSTVLVVEASSLQDSAEIADS